MTSYRKKPCKRNQVRNPETGRCIKRSALAKLKKSKLAKLKKSKLVKRKKSKSVARKSPSKYLKAFVEEGECRGRTQESCNSRPNCSYRKNIGCVRKYGAVKRGYKFEGPIRRSPKKPSPKSFSSPVHPSGVNFIV